MEIRYLIGREDMLLRIRTQTPVLPPPVSLQVNTESQMASGVLQNGSVLTAQRREYLTFSERSAARRRSPESQEAAFRAHTLIKTILSLVYEGTVVLSI